MNIVWCPTFISDFLALIFLTVISQTYFFKTFVVHFFEVISIYNMNNNFSVVSGTSWTVCSIVFSLLFLTVIFLSVGHDHLTGIPNYSWSSFPTKNTIIYFPTLSSEKYTYSKSFICIVPFKICIYSAVCSSFTCGNTTIYLKKCIIHRPFYKKITNTSLKQDFIFIVFFIWQICYCFLLWWPWKNTLRVLLASFT
jgi:hypothetical protein